MRSIVVVATLLLSTAASAQNSAPQPLAIVNTIPDARDVDYPGTIQLAVDATDIARAIFRVKQSIPVDRAGRMVLLSPAWLPGVHAARGPIERLAGLKIRAGGKTVAWKRDPVDVWAFHLDVPEGARQLDLEFQYLSPTAGNQGRIEVTPKLLNLQFGSVSLYPAGYYTRRIPIQATVQYPNGWTASSGLPSRRAGSTYTYQTTSYETLQDSPVFAGQYFKQYPLTDRVNLNIVADSPEELEAAPEQIAAHRRLVEQSVKLFGAQHYDRYEFLLAITDEMGGIGLEHHRSSENQVDPGYFAKWNDGPGGRNILPHEFAHSWNGKFRRGADSWAPDFRTPMRNSLLWVYEGQTQFWGYVLQARSGMVRKQDTLDQIAMIAASLDARPARSWRPLLDTTNDPIITPRKPKAWVSWQRSEDYYNEGLLVWLETDSLLRKLSNGRRSMDDFARAFFGLKDGDWGEVTYTFQDVVATLNAIQPHDWTTFLNQRLEGVSERAPLGGLEGGGYRLVFTDTPTPAFRNSEKANSRLDLTHSLGLTMAKGSAIQAVNWDSPAFDAGLDVGDTILAVAGREYSEERLKDAIRTARGGNAPIQLLLKNGTRYRQVAIDYRGGLRYPRLEKIGTGEGGLDRLLAPR